MKRSKTIGLTLNKKVISNFTKEQLNGGSSDSTRNCPSGGTGGTYNSHEGSFCVCL